MSTHSKIPELRRRGIGLTALSILSGLLLALQFVLPPAAFAAQAGNLIDPPEAQARSEVSVVRLVVVYTVKTSSTGKNSATNPTYCTGLGVLVKSWPFRNPTELNSWVLTDSSLVKSTSPICAAANLPTNHTSDLTLSSINVYANTFYTGSSTPPGNSLLGSVTSTNSIRCQVQVLALCSSGPALIGFHTQQPQPVVSVISKTSANTTPAFGIELISSASSSPLPPQALQSQEQAQGFLEPSQRADQPNSRSEGGMPLMNSQGQLVGMNPENGNLFPAMDITTFLGQQTNLTSAPDNPLETAWDTGITAYYAQQYGTAVTAFRQVETLNPTLKAAATFEQEASSHLNSSPGNRPGTPGQAPAISDLSTILVAIGLVAGVLLLILLLVMVSLRTRRRHELARFEVERAEAQRIADRQVQQMQRSKATANLQQPVAEMSCPNCGVPVHVTDSYCPKCHYLLSPSDSGLHLHAAPPSSPALQTQPPVNYPAPASSISDLPTVEFTSVDGEAENERTVPYSIQQLQGRNLSLAVGYLTDPGIKRKHKPNEDSLFAIQGAKTYDSQPQQFGLFVVADGMGGHANGQDASRLAIQTIIDYMLPRISTSNGMNDEAFLGLLRDGVQHANQAVHQRNIEERADMGTTMTAALVVGAIAYVANVGDSRTYLYREPEGLVKITHDHSVVASLVDAGIIKPDDIYTHPKRNQIYRSLGEKPVVDVDAFRVPLQPGDKLLLCSDGLWDMVRDPDIQRLMSAPAPDPSKTGRDLIQAALEGGGEDNVSVIVVSVTEATSRNGTTGIQLLTKPDTVTVPNLQLM